MKYSFDSRIRFSETGTDRRLTIDSLVDYFQDCAVFQSEEIGFGPKVWDERQAAWVIVTWRIRVKEYPQILERVKAWTWAYGFRGIQGDRNFLLTREDGRTLAEAESRWIFFDWKTQKPARVPEDEKAGYGLEERLDMPAYPRHVILPEDAEKEEPFVVHRTQIDSNLHVNNRQYIRMAMAYLPDDYICRELLVDYHRQARLDDVIYPKVARTEVGAIVSLDDAEGTAYAVVEFR